MKKWFTKLLEQLSGQTSRLLRNCWKTGKKSKQYVTKYVLTLITLYPFGICPAVSGTYRRRSIQLRGLIKRGAERAAIVSDHYLTDEL